MKKILLVAGVVFLSLTSLTANAQEKSKGLQGVWWAAGQVSFNSTETGDAKTTNNMILPIVGTFVSPDVTVALGIGNINSTTKEGSVTIAESNTFVIKPLARKYWNIKGGLFFFGQAALPIMLGKDKITDDKTSSVALEFAPGFDYVINKWLTVETSFTVLSVGTSTTTPKVGEKTTDFDFNANPMNSVADRSIGGLQVGVKILF
jgi:hypothetical protein